MVWLWCGDRVVPVLCLRVLVVQVEAFPVQARYSAVAIGYNAAHAVTGAAPLLCTYLSMHVSLMAPG